MLLRREREPPHHRLFDLVHDLAAGQLAERVRLAGQLGGAERADVEVPPPGGLGLAPVPVDQVGQQRPRPLLAGALVRPDRDPVQQGRTDPGDLGILGRLRWFLDERAR